MVTHLNILLTVHGRITFEQGFEVFNRSDFTKKDVVVVIHLSL